jgi:hypothetical protein
MGVEERSIAHLVFAGTAPFRGAYDLHVQNPRKTHQSGAGILFFNEDKIISTAGLQGRPSNRATPLV